MSKWEKGTAIEFVHGGTDRLVHYVVSVVDGTAFVKPIRPATLSDYAGTGRIHSQGNCVKFSSRGDRKGVWLKRVSHDPTAKEEHLLHKPFKNLPKLMKEVG